MTTTLIMPTSAELQLIAQEKTPVLTMDDPIFQILPVTTADEAVLMWEQRDNYLGLQGVRGLNGQPGRVNPVGGKRYVVTPGYYGEYGVLNELMLTTRRAWGSFGMTIDVRDMVMEWQDFLLNRRIDRWRYIGWTLLSSGTFSASRSDGTVEHTDSYTLQHFTASPLWSTTATAHPLADLRANKLLGRGKGVNFGSGSTLYMNQSDVNNLLNNTNASDLFGRRTQGVSGVNNLSDLNAMLAGDDLPKIVVYDEGYLDSTGTFQLFIAAGSAVHVGKRLQGQVIGDICATRNANNPDLGPGPYQKIIDRGEDQVPRVIEVHDGANFAPRLYYPGSVIYYTI
jgi:hypothetical protein